MTKPSSHVVEAFTRSSGGDVANEAVLVRVRDALADTKGTAVVVIHAWKNLPAAKPPKPRTEVAV